MSLVAGFCALAMPCAMQAGYDFDENGNAFATGQAILSFKDGASLITIKSILARYGADPSNIRFIDDRAAVVRFSEKKDVSSFCQQMLATKWVTAASPDHLFRALGIPNDPLYSLQWGLKPGTVGVTATVGADFQGALSYVSTSIGSGVKVGVLDSGIDLLHPEFLAVPNGPLIPSVGQFYRAMTLVPALPILPSSDPPYGFAINAPNDDVGHGTHVAGTIAARTGNGKGVAGAAPGSIIYPIKIFNRTTAYGAVFESILASGIRFAATNGCRVINMSVGGTAAANSFALTNAMQFAQTQTIDRTVVPNVTFKGVVCVVAMGNDTARRFNMPVVIPGVVAVGAHGPDGAQATFSTTGPHITLSAPGGDGGAKANNAGQIFSTYPTYMVSGGPPLIPKPTYTSYSYMSGTSMAAPHVAAAAALLLQKKPYLSQAQVWAQLALFSTHTAPINMITGTTGVTTPIPDSAFDESRGYGILNANSLVQGKMPALGNTTGIPHVFPVSPRSHFTYTATSIPITNATLTGLETWDVRRGNATNTFRVIVVDDKGERIPSAQVTARFTLLWWPPWPAGYPTSNVVDTPLLDNGTVVQDDLLNQDAVYGCTIQFPGSFSNCLFGVRYLVTAPGMKPNTNKVVNIWVQ